jgi:3-phosphoshikimate 1-carboxyvinyltransferase
MDYPFCLQSFGCPTQKGILIQGGRLRACPVDLSDCPISDPSSWCSELFARGKTVLHHAGRLRYKESDRIAAMEEETDQIRL